MQIGGVGSGHDTYSHQVTGCIQAVKGEDGSREQEVEIYYRFIGKID